MFQFQISATAQNSRARSGTFYTPHGSIETPVFMPVGTKAVVKTLTSTDLHDLGAEIILANSYHLAMRPGSEFIAKMDGLHQWTNWKKPILTDSGGFQVFSLKHLTKVTDEGVYFQSHLDGSSHFFSPESVISIQNQLGADIIMAFDECIPADSSKDYAKTSLSRTHHWAKRCQKAHKNPLQALFPIIQGATYDDLRIKSSKFLSHLNLPGIAIGGLSVGESKEIMYHILEVITPHLPQDKPRYLMGVGTPEDIIEAIDRGIDMFDCVLATRLARHGAFYSAHQREHIKNEKFKNDRKPLQKNCHCYTCQNFSRSYLRHLVVEKEITALRLLTIHNLHFLLELIRQIRAAIKENRFLTFKKDFLNQWIPQGKHTLNNKLT